MSVKLARTRQKEFTQPVRIGVDGRRLGPNRKGIGRYVWELCKELDRILPTAQFFLYSQIPPELPPISRRWSIRLDDSAVGQRMPNNLWLATRAGLMSRRDNLDAFWAGTGLLPLVGLKTRGVLTVHDLVQKVAPETMDFKALMATRLFFSRSLAKADAIVSNSSGTAERLGKPSAIAPLQLYDRVCPESSTPILKVIRQKYSHDMECPDPIFSACRRWSREKVSSN